MNAVKLIEIVWEAIIKEFFGILSKSLVVAIGTKLLFKNLPWVSIIIIFFIILCVFLVGFYIKRKIEIIESYKALERTNNWEYAYAEKIILQSLVNKGLKRFLLSDDLVKMINNEFLDIDEVDLEPEELSVIYEALQQIRNQENLKKIIENLIAREFVKPINEKGLLDINIDIYNFILRDKQKIKKRIEKSEKKQIKNLKKLKKQQLRKQKPTFIRKIQLYFVNSFPRLIKISKLSHTWILDVDGTLVKHNGYKIDGFDTLLEGVKDFFLQLPQEDKVILLTGRKEEFLPALKTFLKENNIRYDHLLTDMPMGERILINDRKPSGLDMAYGINKNRDEKLDINFIINEEL